MFLLFSPLVSFCSFPMRFFLKEFGIYIKDCPRAFVSIPLRSTPFSPGVEITIGTRPFNASPCVFVPQLSNECRSFGPLPLSGSRVDALTAPHESTPDVLPPVFPPFFLPATALTDQFLEDDLLCNRISLLFFLTHTGVIVLAG